MMTRCLLILLPLFLLALSSVHAAGTSTMSKDEEGVDMQYLEEQNNTTEVHSSPESSTGSIPVSAPPERQADPSPLWEMEPPLIGNVLKAKGKQRLLEVVQIVGFEEVYYGMRNVMCCNVSLAHHVKGMVDKLRPSGVVIRSWKEFAERFIAYLRRMDGFDGAMVFLTLHEFWRGRLDILREMQSEIALLINGTNYCEWGIGLIMRAIEETVGKEPEV